MLVLTTAGELVGVTEARERPLEVAAANWVASALAVAAVHPDALMLDVGSTTADVIPIAAGRVAAAGRTDLDRLLAGELVYTGVLRTNLAAIAPRVPSRGGWCPVASELFAISADVHLILGHLAPDDYTCPTPDGRAGERRGARERVARLVCADAEQLAPAEIDAIAAYLHGEQVGQIEAAARDVAGVGTRAPVVPLGGGAFLAREVAARLGRPVAEMPWTEAERDAAPAAALAELAAARVRARADGRQGRRRAGARRGRRRAAGAVRGDRGGGRAPPLLVVPGGGELADAVRALRPPLGLRAETAHWMAILAMDQFGWALADLIPGAALRTDLAAARRRGGPAPLRAAARARSAARVVGRHLGLDRRVGRRRRRAPRGSCSSSRSRGSTGTWPPAGEPIAELTVDELAALRPGGVDAHLPAALRAAGVETWVIDGREPRRLAELLDRGRTAGDADRAPRVARAALGSPRPRISCRSARAGAMRAGSIGAVRRPSRHAAERTPGDVGAGGADAGRSSARSSPASAISSPASCASATSAAQRVGVEPVRAARGRP